MAVESTYNWYWLVDLLMDHGYKTHLANPSAMQQYKGRKRKRAHAISFSSLIRYAIMVNGVVPIMQGDRCNVGQV